MSNTNNSEASLQLVTTCLRPYMVGIENEIQRVILPTTGRNANKYFVRWDVRELLRGDFKTTQDGYNIGRMGGWYSVNEIRNELGENSIGPVGDVYLVPVIMANAETLLAKPEPVPADPEPEEDIPQDVRSIVQRCSGVIPIFSDSIRRYLNRDKWTLDAVSSIFEPVLRSLVNVAIDDANDKLGTQWSDDAVTERILRKAQESIHRRSESWSTSTADEVSSSEFGKTLKQLVSEVYRECGAALVVQEN